jgi:hypothetical protein
MTDHQMNDQILAMNQQVGRIFEIAGAYVNCGFQIAVPDEEEAKQKQEFLALLDAIRFQETPNDSSSLVAARLLVGLYGVARELLPEGCGDRIWEVFVSINAESRAASLVAIEDAERG